MSTLFNQYYQIFFDFLEKNPAAGLVYLNVMEHHDYTSLAYDTDDKYLIQNQEFLDSLPQLNIYGAVAEEWWLLLAVYGHVREHSMSWHAAPSLPVDKRLEQAAREQVRHGLSKQGRWAKLEHQAENNLFEHLKQQLATGHYSYPVQVASYKQLSELHNEADDFAEELNKRLQRGVLTSLHHRLSFETAAAAPRQALYLLHTEVFGAGSHIAYTFEDNTVVSSLQPQHLRPFQFSGAWIELPDDKQEALSAQLGFIDSRGETTAPDELQSRQLTAQWCLEKGYQQLTLDPGVRNLVEEFGTAVPGHPAKRWLSSGQLLTNLVKCYNLLHTPLRPVTQVDYNDNKNGLPF